MTMPRRWHVARTLLASLLSFAGGLQSPQATPRADAAISGVVRDGLTIRVSADVVLACTREDFLLDVRMTASEDDATTWDRDWSFRIPRDHV